MFTLEQKIKEIEKAKGYLEESITLIFIGGQHYDGILQSESRYSLVKAPSKNFYEIRWKIQQQIQELDSFIKELRLNGETGGDGDKDNSDVVKE